MKPEKAYVLMKIITNNEWEARKETLKEIISIVNSLINRQAREKNYFLSERLQLSNLLVQKIILHGSSILNLVEGIEVPSKDSRIKKLRDPISMNVLFRGLLESYLTLNHFNFSGTEEENEIRFKIWMQYGLRQRGKMTFTKIPFAAKILEKERIDIESLMNEIILSNFYKSLDEDKQRTFVEQIERDWKFGFRDNTYIKFSWQQLLDKTGINVQLFDGTYNLLSWSAHSTCISLWQLNEIYQGKRADTETINIMKETAIFIAFACTDLIKKDIELKKQYDLLTQNDKDLINIYNYMFRGDTFLIEKIQE